MSLFSFSFVGATNASVRNLLGEHIDIGLKKNHSFYVVDKNVLSYQQSLQSQISYDLLTILDVSQNESARRVVLDTYLDYSHDLLLAGPSFLQNENLLISSYSEKIKECETPIKQYNTDFSLAVKQFNYQEAHLLSQTIANLRSCVAEHTVYYKKHLLYRDLVSAFLSTLQKKYDYVLNNKEKIITYYQFMKPELLKELYDISITLESNYSV
ncbi:MAG: hypothetical protein LBH96_05105 [Candidatus Peribacteria bacterium]|nr:hypothetical protein [Candidatus Peribacteria bacterium]